MENLTKNENKVKLYSTKCSRCLMLEKLLENKNIPYVEINDMEIMTQKGFLTVPMLELENGEILDFTNSVKWINSLSRKGKK